MKSRRTSDRCILRWPTQLAEEWTKEFLERAQKNQNILAVVAIGSAVREGVQSDDLDILVLCRCARDFAERTPLEVDLRALNAQSVNREVEAGHDLLCWAIVFGQILFDRKKTWKNIVKSWHGRVPLPNPEVSKNRSVITHRRMEEMLEIGDEDAALELELAYLSHDARVALAEAGIYPASRPELPSQLNEIGDHLLAAKVKKALDARAKMRRQVVG